LKDITFYRYCVCSIQPILLHPNSNYCYCQPKLQSNMDLCLKRQNM